MANTYSMEVGAILITCTEWILAHRCTTQAIPSCYIITDLNKRNVFTAIDVVMTFNRTMTSQLYHIV